MEPDESYRYQHSYEQPKDLTIKTAKKMKPIPPPLNLNSDEESGHVPSILLKEFANFATSPKSPLMQKHLPFRKRAYMISVTVDNSENELVKAFSSRSPLNESEQKVDMIEIGHPSIPTIDSRRNNNINDNKSYSYTLDGVDYSNKNNLQMNSNLIHNYCPRSTTTTNVGAYDKDILPCSNEDCVLDLSTHQNSVLLSPAPSSLGSSREELATDSTRVSPLYQTRLWGLPWPPPVWHCFQSGTKLKVGSVWCTVEEMGPCPVDWPSELKVEQMTLHDSSVIISFSSPLMLNSILAEVSRAHAFLVKDRGWTAVCGETLFSKYSVRCPSLQLIDIVMLPTIHRLPLPLPLPSPDICERIKRFSFPPPDDPQSPHLLSPPTTPTRKSQDCDKPKRPMNAFMLFAKRFRLELIQSHPGKDNRAISVILGEVWRTLPQEEREIYIRGARDLSEEQKLLHPDCWKRKRSHSTS
ncbi:HMG box-containing protein 1-like [Lycorma delicatula]|uniref:HMG box-containing protein 1-like n=1 Tax=Lycorma delicatula TaxID=130591 RepID=UPI003F511E8D